MRPEIERSIGADQRQIMMPMQVAPVFRRVVVGRLSDGVARTGKGWMRLRRDDCKCGDLSRRLRAPRRSQQK